jgi:hypothetical protein
MRTTTGQRSITGTDMTLRCLILSGLMLAAAQLFALTPNWPAGTLRPDMLAPLMT